jgi:4-oxalocrotonate tautomerase
MFNRILKEVKIMPIVQIDLLEGRTLEQKRAMVAKVTDAIKETTNCPADAVTIIIREMPPTHLGKGGKLRSDC